MDLPHQIWHRWRGSKSSEESHRVRDTWRHGDRTAKYLTIPQESVPVRIDERLSHELVSAQREHCTSQPQLKGSLTRRAGTTDVVLCNGIWPATAQCRSRGSPAPLACGLRRASGTDNELERDATHPTDRPPSCTRRRRDVSLTQTKHSS